ncbi:MAG: cytochrome b/b6 domain-containing protein [Pseudomonadota bacterium]|nr:cytochrome b/b6 domain-containing protein [Pseudomonadota bacterium]
MSLNNQDYVKVWDPQVRIFHWSLVVLFFTAYLSEGEPELLHTWAGYGIAGLVIFRLLWGFIGTRHARFRSFVTGPGTSLRYLKQTLAGNAPRHLGHNPAAAAMIIALLACLSATLFSGLALLATEGGGPLAGSFLAGLPEDPVEEVHEFFANATLLLVGLHVLGVLLSSLVHRENLVRSMITGRKPDTPPPASPTLEQKHS